MSFPVASWPYVFLATGPDGPGTFTAIMDAQFRGMITNIVSMMQSASMTSNTIFSLDGVPFGASAIAGLPANYPFADPVSDLLIPVYGGAVLDVNFSGSVGDLFSVWVTGYTFGTYSIEGPPGG
jgi:hypothetical protein